MIIIAALISIALWTAMSARMDATLLAYVLILHHCLILYAAYTDLATGRLLDALAYIIGLALVLHHIIRHVDMYDRLYAAGDVLGTAVSITAYIILPGAYAMVPLMLEGGRAVSKWARG